jgi:hypothetical protein
VTLRVRRGERLLAEMKQDCHIEPFGRAVVSFDVTWPAVPGPLRLEAELRGIEGKLVRSLRDTEIVE